MLSLKFAAARRLAARTEGPVKLIFGHKMYLWCHSGIGHIKIKNSKMDSSELKRKLIGENYQTMTRTKFINYF